MADVFFNEYILVGAAGFNICQVFRVTGIGQAVHIDDAAIEVRFRQQIPDEVAADKSAAAGYKKVHDCPPGFPISPHLLRQMMSRIGHYSPTPFSLYLRQT
jgi:hypothetical protein